VNVFKSDGLTKKYGQKAALSNFSFELRGGEIVGLIGRNGAGKTTLMNCIAGNIFSDAGNVFMNDKDVMKYHDVRRDIGIMIDASFIGYLSAVENLKLLLITEGYSNKQEIENRINEVLHIVDLHDARNKKVAGYSYGMKQRLGFAQALLNGRKMLILDEPFAGLDINGRKIVKDYIRKIVQKQNLCVLFSDHNLDEVRDLCSRVICIQEGVKVYDGRLEENREYQFKLQDCDDMLKSELKKLGVNISGNTLLFSQNYDLNEIISTIVKKTKIEKITTTESSLERMLREGII